MLLYVTALQHRACTVFKEKYFNLYQTCTVTLFLSLWISLPGILLQFKCLWGKQKSHWREKQVLHLMSDPIFRSAFYNIQVSTSTNCWKQTADCNMLCPIHPLLTALRDSPRELHGPLLWARSVIPRAYFKSKMFSVKQLLSQKSFYSISPLNTRSACWIFLICSFPSKKKKSLIYFVSFNLHRKKQRTTVTNRLNKWWLLFAFLIKGSLEV